MNYATIEGEPLARAAFNALAFIPKVTKVPLIRFTLTATSLEVTGSDGYAAGKDSAPVHNGPGLAVSFTIEREALVELEAFARAYKKEALALTRYGDELNVAAAEETFTCALRALEHREAWATLDAMFKAQRSPDALAVAFDPALFSRFGKVKTAKERVADYLFVDPEKPALVKVGPTFQGLVMPLYREPAKAYSPEGLW